MKQQRKETQFRAQSFFCEKRLGSISEVGQYRPCIMPGQEKEEGEKPLFSLIRRRKEAPTSALNGFLQRRRRRRVLCRPDSVIALCSQVYFRHLLLVQEDGLSTEETLHKMYFLGGKLPKGHGITVGKIAHVSIVFIFSWSVPSLCVAQTTEKKERK